MPSWTSPRTWVATNTLTAAQLNTDVRDNTTYLYDLTHTTQTFTPQLYQNGNRTSSTAIGRYWQQGKIVTLHVRMIASAAGSAGNAIEVRDIPVAPLKTGTPNASADCSAVGLGHVLDNGTALYYAAAYFTSTTAIRFQGVSNNNGTDIGAAPSFALASGDAVAFNIVYEAA